MAPTRPSTRPSPRTSRGLAVAVIFLLALPGGCADPDPSLESTQPGQDRDPAEVATKDRSSYPASASTKHTDRDSRGRQRTVLAISVDGLRPAAVRRLGSDGTPTLNRLIRQGSSTLNARTAAEDTRTLPNHATMITGRPVASTRGGHGVDVNTDPGGTVHDRAGEHVSSLFQVAARRGGRPALFASKDKFALFQRSWPGAVDRFTYRANNIALTRVVRRDLATTNRSLRFVHYSAPDAAGHEFGFTSAKYSRAVRLVDRQLGMLVRYIESRSRLSSCLTLILTADHGGSGRDHRDIANPADFTVPFITWGAGVTGGTDLYRLNLERRSPGRDQAGYRGRQPIRNGDLANLALDALRLPAVPGSSINKRQSLDLRRP